MVLYFSVYRSEVRDFCEVAYEEKVESEDAFPKRGGALALNVGRETQSLCGKTMREGKCQLSGIALLLDGEVRVRKSGVTR